MFRRRTLRVHRPTATLLLVVAASAVWPAAAHGGGTLSVPLVVEERLGVARRDEPVISGVPLPRAAQIAGVDGLALIDATSGELVPADFLVTARWGGAPDDATRPIRWLLVAFRSSLPAGGSRSLVLTDHRPGEPAERIALSSSAGLWTVDTGAARFELDPVAFDLLHRVVVDGVELVSPAADAGPYYRLDNAEHRARQAQGGSQLRVYRQGGHGQTLTLEARGAHRTFAPGDPLLSDDEDLDFVTFLTFTAGSSWVRIHHTVQNNRDWVALENNADFRNIGSPHAVTADEIGLRLTVDAGAGAAWSVVGEDDGSWGGALTGDVDVYQDSAGGDGWDRWRVRHGTDSGATAAPLYGPSSYVTFPGYEVRVDGAAIGAGERMDGALVIDGPRGGVTVAQRDFWQSYPSALRADAGGRLEMALFPAEFRARHTLRVGEQKSHELLLAFHRPGQAAGAAAAAAVRAPLMARADAAWYAEMSRAVPTVSTGADPALRFATIDAPEERLQVDVTAAEWDAYLLRHLTGPGAPTYVGAPSNDYSFNGMDEAVPAAQLYGWMDWGDLPIDFETEYDDYLAAVPGCGGAQRSVTGQYGWKYDADWGLLVAFVRSGDWRFFERGIAASRHTADIDVLHHGRQSGRGVGDFRDGGMFGHSQHNLDMDRHPHRNGNPESACGGAAWNGTPTADMLFGVGGMALGHWLTGDPTLAESLRDLADWAAYYANTYDTDQGRASANMLDSLAWAWQATGEPAYRDALVKIGRDNAVLQNPMGGGWQQSRLGAAFGDWAATRREADDASQDAALERLASAGVALDNYSGDAFRADAYAWAALLLPRDRAAHLAKARQAFASAVLSPAWENNLYGIQRVWQIKEWVNALRAGHVYQLAEYVLRGGPPWSPAPPPVTPLGGASIQNRPPVAVIAGPIAISGGTGEALVFDGRGSNDVETAADALSAYWELGDGTSGTGLLVEHVYEEAGAYPVRLWVGDGESAAVATVTATIAFVNHPPVAAAGDDRVAPEGVTLLLDGSASSDPDRQPLEFRWEFGDGTGAAGEVVEHAWSTAGSYTVVLTVSDGTLASRDELTVRVRPVTGVSETRSYRRGVDGYDGASDTRLWAKFVDYNYGACSEIYVGRQDYPELHALLRFELAGIPAGARVERATLELTTASAGSAGTVHVHRMITPWSEGTLCVSQIDGATWNSRDGATAWETTAGGGDFVAAQATFTAAPVGTAAAIDVTPIVQDWVLGTPNDGLALTLDAAWNYQYVYLATSEAELARRPSLTVTWTPVVEECSLDADCDDGLYCNGVERCVAGLCEVGADPCGGGACDESRGCISGCDADGLCEPGEDCRSCPSDCGSGAGGACGDLVCDPLAGESCLSCPLDCNGAQTGKPAGRFCCGDGAGFGAVGCGDSRCVADGWACVAGFGSPTCCGDGSCDVGESRCSCGLDCGVPPASESPGLSCDDGIDDDCDGFADCNDLDCADDPSCRLVGCDHDGVCEAGEDCRTCAADCAGVSSGPKSKRYCCGDGTLQDIEGDGTICDGNP